MRKLKLWKCNDWGQYVDPSDRNGLHLRFDAGVDLEVHRACLEFAAWLRRYFVFPLRVYVWLKNKDALVLPKGKRISSIFMESPRRMNDPCVRIAVGNYDALVQAHGKDGALVVIMTMMTFELSHYFQWLKGLDLTRSRKAIQARYYTNEIMNSYLEEREHL